MAKFFNVLLIAFAVFFLSFVWIFYYVKVAWICALSAGSLALITAVVLYYTLPRKTKRSISKNKQKTLEKFLIYMATEDAREIISSLFEKKGFTTFFLQDGFVAKKSTTFLVVVWLNYRRFEKQNLVDVIKLKSKVKAEAIVFFGEVGFDTKSLCQYTNTKFVVFSLADTYDLLEKNVLLPELPSYNPPKDKRIFIYAFNSKRFPHYVVSSIFLALISIVSFFPIYTLIMSTILLAMGVYSKVNKRFNNTQTKSFV